MSERPLDAEAIRAFLLEVADSIPTGERHSIIVVGGALLALHHLRATTADVDAVRQIPEPVRLAVQAVAHRHDLAPKWLNDAAAAFRPATLDDEDCEVLIDHPRLQVLGAPLRQVFLMKVDAARTRDFGDLVALWPHCEFDSPEQAVAEYLEAFPDAPDDPFLSDWIADIADRSERP
jgi:hypothetical protein